MSNVNKVASFSRLRNERMPSNTLSRKGREIQHHLSSLVDGATTYGPLAALCCTLRLCLYVFMS